MQKSPLCIFFPLIPFNLQKIRANSSLSRLFAPFPTSIPTPSALIVPFLFFVQDYSVAAIHYEPFGLYPGKTKSLNDLADGAKIAVPNDATNEARALQLLAAQGIITLKEDAGLAATKNDVVDNPHNIELVEMEAAQLPRTLSDVDFAVINGNYAAEAGFSASKDALAVEDATSEAAQTYANLLVVEEGNENEPAIKALVAALTSQTVKDYIDSTYDGAVVAIF